MNEADFLICAVLLISTVVGVSRGVVREILAIVAWVVAIFLAIRFAPELGDKIPLESMGPLVRNALAGVVIVVLTLFSANSAPGSSRRRRFPLKIGRSDRFLVSCAAF